MTKGGLYAQTKHWKEAAAQRVVEKLPPGGRRELIPLFCNEFGFPLTSLQGLEVSVKPVMKYAVMHAKYEAICMKAYCGVWVQPAQPLLLKLP